MELVLKIAAGVCLGLLAYELICMGLAWVVSVAREVLEENKWLSAAGGLVLAIGLVVAWVWLSGKIDSWGRVTH